jgi:hypothetical protein
MSKTEMEVEADEDEVSLERVVSVSRYPGCDPVTVRTTRLSGEESSREERIRAGLRRLAQEGRISLHG